ncbi:ATP-binding cassette domain-containing protein [Clostridium sp. MCC353]|uniref:ABC transporter ATP-binding protein n=1 Tax=Clostridium sp. MCC353 TaxID=2592646 RepID=UPI001C0339FA|nr:ABC transporter ATP-binding protein [Clostridium sp. MCC353]MBT9778893.1 ATP-binding cassette domain-containing protein [Clostridium sp. MCC353]
MADKNIAVPPRNLNGISRPGHGRVVVKPKDMKGTLCRLWVLTKGQRKGLGWILLLSAFSSAASIFSPYLTGKIVTMIVNGDAIIFVLSILSGLYISDWLIRFLQQFFMASIGQNIIRHIRKVLFDHIKTLPLAFFDRKQHGELMSRLTNDVDNISTTISNSLTLLLTYLFTITGIFVMMVCLSPLLTLVSLAGIVLIFLLTKAITKRTRKLFAAQQKALGTLNGQVEESISGLAVVKTFCREKQMEAEFRLNNDNLCSASIKALVCSGYLMPLMNVINNLCYVALAVFSGVLFINGTIRDIGLITSFLLYVRQFTRPFVEIANIYNNFQTAVAGAERVFEILDEPSEPEDKTAALDLKDTRGTIALHQVEFGYTPEKAVLKDISLQIPAGTQVAIVGPTGSGKTTIINLLTRFYDVTSGKITLDGHDLRDYKMKSLRSTFGVVLQDTALFAESVLDNIRYGHKDASEEEVQRAARIAGADGFIERLPHGYHTVLEQGGNELSQGERQLLTIARAVLTNAPIVILDEATSSVDTITEQKIRKAMLKICEGRTSFIIAHRLSTIRDSDRIILIEDGRIAEQGSHDELIALGGRYADMYHTQSGNLRSAN